MFLNDREKWDEIRDNAEYKPLRDEIERAYESICKGKDIPRITFRLETEILRTGNRTKFEQVYFEKRKQLTLYTLMLLLHPDSEEYKEGLEEVICDICNEYTWELPAHRAAEYFNTRDGIDLFAAETGLYLAEVKAMLSDILHPYVTERITLELRRRIIESFQQNTFFFETVKSNWAAVCGGSVGAVLLYESPETHHKVFERIYRCMNNYIDGFSDDGATSEGSDYWAYGFAYYVLYADLLRRYSCGKMDLFNREKVKKIAGFFNAVCLDEHNVVSFADSSIHLGYQPFLPGFLHLEYGTPLPPVQGEAFRYNKLSWSIRSCLYYLPGRKPEKLPPMKKYFDEAQWYIERKEKDSFAAKGGHNAEEHNHNDIGSFIVTHDGQAILTDLGAPEYTLKGFGKESYETVLNKSSFGHSVPIVNGTAQKYGREYYGALTVNGEEIGIDLARAYPTEIKTLTRSFRLSEDAILLRDVFDGSLPVTERFVTEIEPDIRTDHMIIGGVRFSFSEKYKVGCQYEDINSHSGAAEKRRVYLIDFSQLDREFEMKIEF